MMKKSWYLVPVLSGAIFWPVSEAHHSTAEYDHSSIVELEGELISVYWGNPHPRYTLKTTSSEGQAELLELEGSAVYVLERVGVREQMLSEGAYVRVAGYRSTRRPQWIQVANMLLEDGYEVLERGAQPRWTQTSDGRSPSSGDSENTEQRQTGLFRVWSRAALGDGLNFGELPLTAEAAVRQAEWHPVDDNPAFQCVTHGMPAIMPNPFPIEFIDNGDSIVLSLSNTVIRTIHLSQDLDPNTVSATKQGYSVGQWDGQILDIKTTRIDWPYFDDNGTPQSERVELVESFILSEDGSHLDYEITVTDPGVFTRPVMSRVTYAALGEPLHNYQYCPEEE
jgi:hypothetical protein